VIDAFFGIACIVLLPWIRNKLGNAPDGAAPKRARGAAVALGVLCLLWFPYRLSPTMAGAAQPVVETAFTVIFVASGLFLLAASQIVRGNALARYGAWLGLALLLMYARRWVGGGGPAEWLVRLVPVVAGLSLIALALDAWRGLAREPSPIPS
jgi:hypothetical protein